MVADEVFAGLWRLGVESAAVDLLGIQPDVGCFAKLLTAGIVPLSLTLATEEVFDAFKGDSKALALLHGHSYTAHPVGCAAANYALGHLRDSPAAKGTPLVIGRAQRARAAGLPRSTSRSIGRPLPPKTMTRTTGEATTAISGTPRGWKRCAVIRASKAAGPSAPS